MYISPKAFTLKNYNKNDRYNKPYVYYKQTDDFESKYLQSINDKREVVKYICSYLSKGSVTTWNPSQYPNASQWE
jgi:hypothetical protein